VKLMGHIIPYSLFLLQQAINQLSNTKVHKNSMGVSFQVIVKDRPCLEINY
jgi:hypothetical protein